MELRISQYSHRWNLKGVEGGWKWREGCIDAPEKATARLARIATRRREGPRTCHQSCLGQRWFVTCFALVQSPYSSLRWNMWSLKLERFFQGSLHKLRLTRFDTWVKWIGGRDEDDDNTIPNCTYILIAQPSCCPQGCICWQISRSYHVRVCKSFCWERVIRLSVSKEPRWIEIRRPFGGNSATPIWKLVARQLWERLEKIKEIQG